MARVVVVIQLAIGMLMFINGCTATIPSVKAWRPWIRAISSNQEILPTAKITTEVNGQSLPLLGEETLTSDQIKQKLNLLLARRGFVIRNGASDYKLILKYKTERRDKPVSLSYSSSSGLSVTKYGLGIDIAQEVHNALVMSRLVNMQTSTELASFTHTISVELYDELSEPGEPIWKGESTWDSGNINIISDMITGLQLVLSYLPAQAGLTPKVDEVKPSHARNYYNLVCRDRRFACPALPFKISFAEPKAWDERLPGSIKDENALAAFVDLIQTAEYALPAGDDDWSNPTKIELWKKVKLGGRYSLSPTGRFVNILIELSGKEDAYYIKKAWIASDAEYAQFEDSMSSWRKALVDYYDVFVR